MQILRPASELPNQKLGEAQQCISTGLEGVHISIHAAFMASGQLEGETLIKGLVGSPGGIYCATLGQGGGSLAHCKSPCGTDLLSVGVHLPYRTQLERYFWLL